MEFIKRNRVYPVDVLMIDYEFCTISFYGEGPRNDLGEPGRILIKRTDNVRCSIDPIVKMPKYISQSGIRDILLQGIVEKSAFIVTLCSEKEIRSGDVVTNYDDVSYEVIHVIDFYTHKEAFLRKLTN